jgi:hypothetical protein
MSVAAADSRVGTLQENVGSGPWDGELGEAGRSAAADEGGGKGQGNISSGPADAEMGEAGGSTGGVPLAAAAGEGEGATSRAFSEYAMHSFQLLS